MARLLHMGEEQSRGVDQNDREGPRARHSNAPGWRQAPPRTNKNQVTLLLVSGQLLRRRGLGPMPWRQAAETALLVVWDMGLTL